MNPHKMIRLHKSLQHGEKNTTHDTDILSLPEEKEIERLMFPSHPQLTHEDCNLIVVSKSLNVYKFVAPTAQRIEHPKEINV